MFPLLVGIASCSHHAVSGTSSQTLSSAVTEMFIPYLQQEGIFPEIWSNPICPKLQLFDSFNKNMCTMHIFCHFPLISSSCLPLVHEGTLVHAVSVLSQWSSRLTVEIPSALIDWLKKAFTLKTSTTLVRHAYIQAMVGAFKGQPRSLKHNFMEWILNQPQTVSVLWPVGDTLAQASDLIPLLLQTVEKAVAQNSQHALVAEGVAASVLLSRLALLETQSGEIFDHHIFSINT